MNLSVPCAASRTETADRTGVVLPPVKRTDREKQQNCSDAFASFMQTTPFDFMTRKICSPSGWFSTRDVGPTGAILTWIKLKLQEDIRSGVRDDLTRNFLLRTSLTIRFLLQKDYH